MKKHCLLTGIILLTTIFLIACRPQKTMESDSTFDFVVLDGIPTVLQKGDLYQLEKRCIYILQNFIKNGMGARYPTGQWFVTNLLWTILFKPELCATKIDNKNAGTDER